MNLSALKNVLRDEPKYRLKQAKKAVFVDFVESWAGVTTLSAELRDELKKQCPLDIKAGIYPPSPRQGGASEDLASKEEKIPPTLSAELHLSGDGRTAKAVIDLPGGFKIESVLMRYEVSSLRQAQGRNTICLSSQVGCALGCNFCATGKMGFKRNLTADEIIDQVLLWARYLNKSNDRVTNIVFMGMGEPFLNYDNVLESIRILNDKDGFNLGARHFSISTAGIVGGIKKLAEEPLQINLAISLHAPDDKLRSKLMPIGKEYPIPKILAAVDGYIEKTNRKVMFEYIMINSVNDSEKQARQLARIVKKPLYFINLISCNPVGDFRPSPQERIEKFKKILKDAGVQVNQRYSFGRDINAACGQLVSSI